MTLLTPKACLVAMLTIMAFEALFLLEDKQPPPPENLRKTTTPKTGVTPKMEEEMYDFDKVWTPIHQKLCPNMVPNVDMGNTLLALARDEIQMKQWNDSETTTQERFFDRFFRQYSIVDVYNAIESNVTIVFPSVLKIAHHQIIDWFNGTFAANVPGFSENDGRRTHDILHSLVEQRRHVCAVMAIRDPVARFLSGYNEVEFRIATRPRAKLEEDAPKLLFHRYREGSKERFEDFVADFLGGPTRGGWEEINGRMESDHLNSMAAALHLLAEEHIALTDYLSSLQNLSTTWPQFVHDSCPGLPSTFTSTPMDLSGQHRSSKDVHGFYKAAKDVWADGGPTARALCAMHAIDYSCFQSLDIPAVCKDVFASKHFADTIISGTNETETS